MDRTRASLTVLVLLALALVLSSGGRGCTLPVVVPDDPKQTLIVMLYEATNGPLPPYALGAANDLSAAGREVRPADDDEVTGLGETPKWLKPALEPGRAIMGGTSDDAQKDDALIVLSGEKVLKAMKLPATRELIIEAVK